MSQINPKLYTKRFLRVLLLRWEELTKQNPEPDPIAFCQRCGVIQITPGEHVACAGVQCPGDWRHVTNEEHEMLKQFIDLYRPPNPWRVAPDRDAEF